MKRGRTAAILLLTIITSFFWWNSCLAQDRSQDQSENYPRRILWDFRDDKDDDKGPGYYDYPLWKVFNDGAFDLRRFRVIEDGRFIELEFTFEGEIQRDWAEGSEKWTADNGWILQTIDIYIDKDHKAGSGVTRTLPGRNVNFRIDSGWENMVLVSPRSRETVIKTIKNKTEDMEFLALETKIIVPSFYTVKRYQIVARIDRKTLGDPQPWWGWQALVLCNDDRVTSNSFYNRDVVSFKTNYKFGGGADYDGDPNVLDLLSPDKSTQYRWLSNYRSHPDARKNRYAVIEHVYTEKAPQKQEFSLPHKDYLKIFAEMAADSSSPGSSKKSGAAAMPPTAPQMDRNGQLIQSSDTSAASVSSFDRRGLSPSEPTRNQNEVQSSAAVNETDMVSAPAGKTSRAVKESRKSEQVDPQMTECRSRMEQILKAAVDYHTKSPQDENITLLDLIYAGYFKENLSCPAGGKYAIYGEETGKLKVRCFNPSGVEHGYVE